MTSSAICLYVSPGQINFLIPYELTVHFRPGCGCASGDCGAHGPERAACRDDSAGDTAPGFFQWNGNFAVAEHADGSLITASAPAQASEIDRAVCGRSGTHGARRFLRESFRGAATILYASRTADPAEWQPSAASSMFTMRESPRASPVCIRSICSFLTSSRPIRRYRS